MFSQDSHTATDSSYGSMSKDEAFYKSVQADLERVCKEGGEKREEAKER
jgi:hypothetical protein